jgi:hypothetical protein
MAVACGGHTSPTAGPAAGERHNSVDTTQSDTASSSGHTDPTAGGAADTSANDQADAGATAAGTPATGSSTPTHQSGGSTKAAPSGQKDPYANVVPVTASLSPTCVTPGDSVQLNVVTDDGAFLGYQAVYSDGQGGGAPPFGAGYGGNDKGRANDAGHFTTSWTVAPTAPVGRGYVDVVVASNGKFGKTRVPFRVAGTGGCD